MTFPFWTDTARDQARQDWIDDRLREARIVVADVAHHSDHLIRLACKTLIQHAPGRDEREDARILLIIVDGKSPERTTRSCPKQERG